MLIEEYFARIRNFLNGLAIVQKFELETEARADYIGFIRVIVYFQDGTILHIREFVDVELSIDRGKYSYQYMDQDDRLIFRYDNAPHHQKLNISTFPHHKHQQQENNIVSSNAPFIEEICQEIEQIIK
ncbi:MAG: DUF6516 family protein [Pseudanabaena sp.]